MLKTKTPDNINEMTINEVTRLVPNDGNPLVPAPANRMKVIRIIFQILGYDLSPDLAFALCAEPLAQLIIATAGGGKTTGAQINAILQKIWRKSSKNPAKKITGDKILCLVYNKHNVKPMEDKHKALVNRLRMSNISDLNIDDTINAATMHSFCDQIRKENVALMGLIGFHLQKDTEAEALMRIVSKKVQNKHKNTSNVSETDLLALYNYAHESMLEVAQLEETDKFQDVKLPADIVEDIFIYYDKLKRAKRRYDYVDLLTKVYVLLRDNAEALKKTQRYFEYIIADEIQDFTPIMMSILQLFVSDGTPLMCIGDEDQGIYNFRGADIYNTLDFEQKFSGGEVYSLTRNRRCATEILDLAKGVISENKIRYHKLITGVRTGGRVDKIPYTSIEGEHLKLVSLLKKLEEEQLRNSVICYRDRNSSVMITELLAEEGIPFHVISGYGAYSHILYRDLISIFNALEAPFDKALSISLYKVLPIKKDKIFSVFGWDPAARRFKTDTKQHFASYDYGDAMGIHGFPQAIAALKQLSDDIQAGTMDRIFPIVFNMLKKYHWNLLRRDRESVAIYDDFIEMRVDKIFNQHKPYSIVYQQLVTKMNRCNRNEKHGDGIAISTFHSLKGLEFDRSYIIDLDNDKFPNFNIIDNRPYSDKTKNSLKECETRLFYVAVTRARDELFLFYKEDNPSRYLYPYVKVNKAENKLPRLNMSQDEIISQLHLEEHEQETEKVTAEMHVPAEQTSISAPASSENTEVLLELLEDDLDEVETVPVYTEHTAITEDLIDLLEEDNDDEAEDTLIAEQQGDNRSIDNGTVNVKAESGNVLQQMDIDAIPLSSAANKKSGYINNLITTLGG